MSLSKAINYTGTDNHTHENQEKHTHKTYHLTHWVKKECQKNKHTQSQT